MMKKVLLGIWLVFISFGISGQLIEPVTWSYGVEKISDTEIELSFHAEIEKGWHLYGLDLPEGGPLPTVFKYENISGIAFTDKTSAVKPPKEAYDPMFAINLTWYDDAVTFVRKGTLNTGTYAADVIIDYMVCSNEQCAPLKKTFSIEGKFELSALPAVNNTKETTTTPIKNTAIENELPVEESSATKNEDTIQKQDYWHSVIEQLWAYDNTQMDKGMSWWLIFISGFIGGLIALLTPCVWPIIPMTVSFFLKRNKDREKGIMEAFLYGFSIIVIYVGFGLIITLLFGSSALNSLSTNAVFNIFIFLLLIVFGVSLLGAFEIVLPSAWTNKMDAMADKTTGIVSIFFMAFTLVLVSFSCTGPIIGTLLVEVSIAKSIAAPLIGMFGFALALSIPFSLFALFPAWLNSVPRSGSWMQTVKITLGVLELAFAMKFLSVADMAYGWNLISRDTFLLIWMLLFLGLAIYLLVARGKYNPQFNLLRMLISVLSLLFVVYMIPGLFGKPLAAISAFLPPMETQRWKLYDYEIKADFTDFDEAMAFAQTSEKPVLVDFSGYGCVNCRRMEASVWLDPDVYDMLTNDFILVTLFVDDKTNLPEKIKIDENGTQTLLETVGDKWSYLQRRKFGANAQPFYVILDDKGDLKTGYFSFTKDAEQFEAFLKSGL